MLSNALIYCITLCSFNFSHFSNINILESLYFRHIWRRKCSYIERCPHFMGQMYKILIFRTAQVVLIRRGVLISGCPYFMGVLISGCQYFRVRCPYFRVSLFQECPYFRVSLFQGVLINPRCACAQRGL